MLADIYHSGYLPRSLSILKTELRYNHRVAERTFILDFIPPNSVGAELGVFTGLFSSLIARNRKIARVTFVDPWWEAFGEFYPDGWGRYSDFGRLRTRDAYETARARVARAKLPNRFVEVGTSYDWLESQPDETLDWVYLDTSHKYEGTQRELKLLNRKMKYDGVIIGDDWYPDQDHRHHGVYLAVNEFIKSSDFELALPSHNFQWILRRGLKGKKTG
jgi:methyltransferase family protein